MPCQRMTPAWSHQMFSNTWKIRRVNSLYTWLFSSHHGRNRIKLRMNGDMECVQSVLFSSDVSFFFLVIAATCYILLYYIYNYPTTTSSTSKLRNLNLYNRNTSDYLLLLLFLLLIIIYFIILLKFVCYIISAFCIGRHIE